MRQCELLEINRSVFYYSSKKDNETELCNLILEIYSNNPVEIAQRWEKNGADMLHIVDLDATLGLGSNLSTIKKIIENIKIPVEIAGGLREESIIMDVAQISKRIVIGTLAFKDQETLKKLVLRCFSFRINVLFDLCLPFLLLIL